MIKIVAPLGKFDRQIKIKSCYSVCGFTLIELLVTIVIAALIAAIAIPSYSDFVERSRRSEARAALGDLADRQEQFFLDNKTYTSSLGDLNVNANTENGYYTRTYWYEHLLR